MNTLGNLLGLDIFAPTLNVTIDGTAGAQAQRNNADAYMAAMRGMQNSIPPDPIWTAAARARKEAEAYLLRTSDHLFWGFLCSMAGALLVRLAFLLH